MKEFFNRLMENKSEGLFKSQDSKFFLVTAFKLTTVPVLSFAFVIYSLWTVLEMNYNFFVANGFASGPVFKDAFIDKVLLNVNEYFLYFAGFTACIFLVGLLVSYLALRPFKEIEDFCEDAIEDPDLEFEVDKISASKLIFQGAKLLFDHLYNIKNGLSNEPPEIPKAMQNMKKPKVDKVFLMQYGLVVAVMLLATNILLYTFTNELYTEIVESGLTLLQGNTMVATFMQMQEATLFSIYSLAIGLNIVLYLSLSKNIIKGVDGVSYGFCRDILAIVKGDKNKRLFPRFNDPGKGAAEALNEYVSLVHEAVAEEQKEEQAEAAKDEKVLDFTAPKAVQSEDLPPAFVEEKQVANGRPVFNITTPKGFKVENLSESQVFKLIKDIENKN